MAIDFYYPYLVYIIAILAICAGIHVSNTTTKNKIINPQLQMIRVYLIIALYVLIPVLIIELFKRFNWMKKIGTVVAAYAIGILLCAF